MLIGLDFDNTIVSYDTLFHKVATEKNVIPETVPVNKVAVRDHLRKTNQEYIWTEMQGYVYGKRMDEAEAYPGVIEFIRNAKKKGHQLCIVSHKTRYPFLGEQYDLYAAAIQWITHHLTIDEQPLFHEDNYFFEPTKDEKVKRIAACACDVYIDDLPEILQNGYFPASCRRILFDPEKHHVQGVKEIDTMHSWKQIEASLL